MRKILLIASLPSSLVNFRGALIEALLAGGYDVDACGPPADAATLLWLDERGVRYHPASLVNTNFSVVGDVRTFFNLRAVVAATRPDVVLAYTIKPVIYGILAAASAGASRRFALITGLGFAFTDGDKNLKRAVARTIAIGMYGLALRFVSGAFFQNPDDAELFRTRRLLPRRIEPIVLNGSGVDLEMFPVAPLPRGVRFLMISRLVADKGVREFVEAARIVKRRRPAFAFDLVGPSDPNPAAIPVDLVPGAVVDGVLTYHGAAKDVRPFLAAASVFVLPSYREGTPRTILEAMATGRAVITTDAPGCRETVVDGDNGYLVPVRDAKALADAMIRLGDDPAAMASMGERGRAFCERKYDVRSVNAAMLSYLNG